MHENLVPSLCVRAQDYEVVVLAGAGIGVTPFASVLADMVNKLESGVCSDCGNVQHVTAGSGAHMEKIYFRASHGRLFLQCSSLNYAAPSRLLCDSAQDKSHSADEPWVHRPCGFEVRGPNHSTHMHTELGQQNITTYRTMM